MNGRTKNLLIICLLLQTPLLTGLTAAHAEATSGPPQVEQPEINQVIINSAVLYTKDGTGNVAEQAGAGDLFHEDTEDFSWIVKDTNYVIHSELLSSTDIKSGNLTKESYDVLSSIGPGEEVFKFIQAIDLLPKMLRSEILKKCFSDSSLSDKKIKYNIRDFIREGGSYIGHCSGVDNALAVKDFDAEDDELTFAEYLYQSNNFLLQGDIDCEMDFANLGFPIEAEYAYGFKSNLRKLRQGLDKPSKPELAGAMGYVSYSGWAPNIETDPQCYVSGACMDCPIVLYIKNSIDMKGTGCKHDFTSKN